ncbi:MAG: hypothetical protein M1833_004095 [Piccolia ochrophora]|nr:MAG: hypothetical protein M1833_004095 [Piccolia ochrophora]
MTLNSNLFKAIGIVFGCLVLAIVTNGLFPTVQTHGRFIIPHLSRPGSASGPSKSAIATFLGKDTAEHEGTEDDDNLDNYFVATRILAYQLRHVPETRSDPSIPFVVIVTAAVSQRKCDRLARDGATIVAVDKIFSSNEVDNPQWQGVWTKLRLFDPRIMPYEKVMYLDSDTILSRPIDGAFNDSATERSQTGHHVLEVKADEAPPPASYVFAGKPDAGTFAHDWPPDQSSNYLNAGFFIFSPNTKLYTHYMSIINSTGKFNPEMPEQNLLNYVHRQEGNMPWRKLSPEWNINFATMKDKEGGVASMHVKYWAKDSSQDTLNYALHWRWEMEGFWKGKEKFGGVS